MTLLSQREARLIAKLEAAHQELTLAHRDLAQSRDELLRVHTRLRKELHDADATLCSCHLSSTRRGTYRS